MLSARSRGRGEEGPSRSSQKNLLLKLRKPMSSTSWKAGVPGKGVPGAKEMVVNEMRAWQ
ncbi:hypothetical protein TrRE_jg1460, partial [Triparma retinervis]